MSQIVTLSTYPVTTRRVCMRRGILEAFSFRALRGTVIGGVFALSCAAAVFGQGGGEAGRLFAEANQAYEQSQYSEAVRKYEQILQYGIHNAAVHYNLGNAHFKLNQLGRAILQFEKAHRLDPGDTDISENLAFANAQRVDKLEELESPFWWGVLSRMHNLLALNTQLVMVVALWLVANVALSLRLLRRNEAIRRLTGWVMLFALLILTPVLISASIKMRQQSLWEGIIVVAKADLLSGPADGNPVLVSVHEGMKVEIRAEASGWYQVVLPNGWNGWVPGSALEVV